jgi:hypothetical protein
MINSLVFHSDNNLQTYTTTYINNNEQQQHELFNTEIETNQLNICGDINLPINDDDHIITETNVDKSNILRVQIHTANSNSLTNGNQRNSYSKQCSTDKLQLLNIIFNDDSYTFAHKMNSFFLNNQMPYYCYDVKGDGRCFYRALAFHLYNNESSYDKVKKSIWNNVKELLKGTEHECMIQDILKEVAPKTNIFADYVSVHCSIINKLFKKNVRILRWNKDLLNLTEYDDIYTYDVTVETIHILHNGESMDSTLGHYIPVIKVKSNPNS